MGKWVYGPGNEYSVERPMDVAKKFTFYTVRVVRAAESAVAAAAAAADSRAPATAGEKAATGGEEWDTQTH